MRLIPRATLVSIDGTEDAVTVAQAKAHLRIDGDADDAFLTVAIKACIARVEQHIERKLITQTWDVYYDDFGRQRNQEPWWDGVKDGAIGDLISPVNEIDLPFGPLQSVVTFKTFGTDDTEYVFPSTEYQIDTKSSWGRVALRYGSVWPTTILREMNGILIQSVYGYGDDSASVPNDIRLAILMFVAKVYENRGDTPQGETLGASSFTMPPTAAMILEPFRRIKVG